MNRETKLSLMILGVGMVALLGYWQLPTPSPTPPLTPKEQIILPHYAPEIYRTIPEVRAYVEALRESITLEQGFLPLEEQELDSRAKAVQQFLLHNRDFLADTTDGTHPLHNDMMQITPAISSMLDSTSQRICQTHHCYQAQKYNFVTNTTTRAIVDADRLTLLMLQRYPQMQPDISVRLTHVAQAIALHAPEVKEALGFTPSRTDITMANVRGTMKESPCENTQHLCVAPTFADHHKAQALWAVVDLTDLTLAAAKWAGLGKTTTPACIAERSLQNRYIMENFCQKDTLLEREGWQITYRLTGSDGLEVRDISFKGERVIQSAKIVDWHVSYQQKGAEQLDTTTPTYIEGRRVEFVKEQNGNYRFGYNDAMGCPLFSTSVVLAFNAPQVKPLPHNDGFMLTQDFRNPKWPMACNYRYENRFEFYRDGSFRIVGVNKGRGCGDHALYRPVMRIDMALGATESFYRYAKGWQRMEKEYQERVPPHTTHYPYKITSASHPTQGFYIEPNYGQFGDQSRGDHATLFVSRFKPQEGDQDLLTLGSCCDLLDDGVERYLEPPESLAESQLVLWYVPRIYNDTRKGQEYCWADTTIGSDGNLQVQVWPCTVGPKFIPIGQR